MCDKQIWNVNEDIIMRHFFETVFYYCYLSYKKHDGGPKLRALSTMTLSNSIFVLMLILTIYIYLKIDIQENNIYIASSPFLIIGIIFYFTLYAKGKYKEIIKKKPKFCNNPKINKRIAWGYTWGISILGILLTSFWDALKHLN